MEPGDALAAGAGFNAILLMNSLETHNSSTPLYPSSCRILCTRTPCIIAGSIFAGTQAPPYRALVHTRSPVDINSPHRMPAAWKGTHTGCQTSWQVETRSFQTKWSNHDGFRPLIMHGQADSHCPLVYASRLHPHHPQNVSKQSINQRLQTLRVMTCSGRCLTLFWGATSANG